MGLFKVLLASFAGPFPCVIGERQKKKSLQIKATCGAVKCQEQRVQPRECKSVCVNLPGSTVLFFRDFFLVLLLQILKKLPID